MTPARAYRLLLVEDNAADADLAAEWLAELPGKPEVLGVGTLSEAVEALARHTFDAVVLDLGLPDGDGIGTLRTVAAAARGAPIVIFSGIDAGTEMARMAEAEGALHVLPKNGAAAGSRLVRSLVRILARADGERSEQYEDLIGVIPDALIVTTPDGVVKYVNPAAEALFGRGDGVLMGERLDFAVKEGEVSEIDILRGEDHRIAEIRVARCVWNGRPAFVAMLRDITDQKSLSEQLRQAQKMEAVGLLAGGVAHDVNNHLLVVQLYADVLRTTLDAGGASAGYIKEIMLAVGRAQSLTRQLLSFSRRQTLELTVATAGEIVAGIESMLRRTLPADIVVRTDIVPDGWPILVDRGQIEQVLMNLAINARDAMPDGGTFTIEVRNAAIRKQKTPAPPGDYVLLRVSDTGTGIEARHLGRIFEPFFTTKERGRGTGLGLATCYGIVSQAKGYITVDSTIGAGTTFTILLPRTRRRRALRLGETEGGQVFGGGERILVVEDDEAVLRATCHILGAEGYDVVSATDGGEARRLLQDTTQEFDLVVSDLVMPALGGLALLDVVATASPQPRVVFMTGYGDYPVSPDTGEPRIGESRVLIKPFHMNDLLRVVREALDGRPADRSPARS